MSRCPTIYFQVSIMSKWLAKHISTKVVYKITIRKRHVYIDIRWPWIWNQYFYLGIWIDDRTEMIVLPSFQLATRLNSKNANKTEFINELWHINLYMNICISNWHNWSFDPTKMKFFILFQVLTRLLTTKDLKPLVHTSLGEMDRCEKRAFQLLKMRKRKISWNIKTKCVTDFLLTVRSSSMMDYTCHYGVST